MLEKQTDRQNKVQRVDYSTIAAEVTGQLNYTIMMPSDVNWLLAMEASSCGLFSHIASDMQLHGYLYLNTWLIPSS